MMGRRNGQTAMVFVDMESRKCRLDCVNRNCQIE